ncbi:MAG: dihydrolipoyl dehydrogenase [Pseudomonadota bacterium]
MANERDVLIPDIGDFDSVEVIEILVNIGDRITEEQSLITLESDKATLDIPAPLTGIVSAIHISVGDKVKQNDLILTVKENESSASGDDDNQTKNESLSASSSEIDAEVIVIGAGPGGYTAAFRAADLGKKTILVERYPTLGGVCLNVGCIPSKALLHVAKVIAEVSELKEFGIDLGSPKSPDARSVRKWTETVIKKLTDGLASMAKQRGITIINGNATFLSPNTLNISKNNNLTQLNFEHAIIAAGSQATSLPGMPDDPRVMDSTDALLLDDIPDRLLVIGGGIIGLEMATVYAALGSKITIVEMMDVLVAGCDKDIVRPLQKRISKLYENIYLSTAVLDIDARKDGLHVEFDGKQAPTRDCFDKILIAVGRQPNGKKLGAEAAGIDVDDRGFIPVDEQQRTNIANIFAIGDIAGQPMLAHKATHEGKLAAEVIAGENAAFDNRMIPSVAYTDPEIAWVGLTETQAKAEGIDYEKGNFPWAASGRSLAIGRDEGMTKLLFDKESKRIIGAAIVGPNAGDLIAECAHAIEMGSDAEDIGLTIHPHPTLSETVAMAAEAYSGTITDLYIPKRK